MFRDPEVVAGLTLENPFAGFRGITHCGEALCSQSHRLPAHRHAGIELTYLTFGRVAWQVEKQVVRQAMGELSLVNAGRWHATAAGRHPEFKALCVGLHLAALGREGIALQRRLRAKDALSLGQAPEFEAILHGLICHAMFPATPDNHMAKKFAELLVAMVGSRLEERMSRRNSRAPRRRIFSLPVQKSVHYLAHHPDRRVSVAELARVAGLGESHFSVSFRREVGLTPCAYHRGLRLEAARKALRLPGYSMAQIAQEMGFSSSQHLSTLFRRAFGCTPRHWRKNESEQTASRR